MTSKNYLVLCFLVSSAAEVMKEEFYPHRLNDDKYPFMVSFRNSSTGGHFCSGSVVSSTYVFTTCQCMTYYTGGKFKPLEPEKFFVLFHKNRESGMNEIRKPDQVILHGNCNKKVHGWENDFAVVKFNTAISSNVTGPPQIVTDEDDEVFDEVGRCKIVDWKITNGLEEFTSLNVTYINDNICQKLLCPRYHRKCRILDFQKKYVCFVANENDSCPQNRGGHLFCGKAFAGIINWTPKCGFNLPIVVSRFDYFFIFYRGFREENLNAYRDVLTQVIRAFIFICITICVFCGIIFVLFFYFYIIFSRRRNNILV